ncbi:MAG: hypothetical protein PUC59_05485 [Firmicutes bacterium]|nr:hypothetical protein [Bacillota bacterium]
MEQERRNFSSAKTRINAERTSFSAESALPCLFRWEVFGFAQHNKMDENDQLQKKAAFLLRFSLLCAMIKRIEKMRFIAERIVFL